MNVTIPSIASASIGLAYGSRLVSTPESLRGRLPEYLDIASTSSNFVTSLGFAMLATELLAQSANTPRRRRIAQASTVIGITLMNLAVENPTINRILVPDEANVVFGQGYGGELRDTIYGIAGGLLGVALGSKLARRSGTATSEQM